MRFHDRVDAGRRLARRLARFAKRPDVLVLALPRGGVPVAYEVAAALDVPLDVFLVRKLGVPGHEELAMGAIASGGVRVLNDDVLSGLDLAESELDLATYREERELARREAAYRRGRPAPPVRGKTVLLVDDGIATGSTMRAAVEALRRLHAGHIVVAAPTAAPSSRERLAHEADEVVTLIAPTGFTSVGEWYEEFPQTNDAEVAALLARTAA